MKTQRQMEKSYQVVCYWRNGLVIKFRGVLPLLFSKVKFQGGCNPSFNSQQPQVKNRVCEVENPHQREMVGQGDITSGGVTDHLPRGSPVDIYLHSNETSITGVCNPFSPVMEVWR